MAWRQSVLGNHGMERKHDWNKYRVASDGCKSRRNGIVYIYILYTVILRQSVNSQINTNNKYVKIINILK